MESKVVVVLFIFIMISLLRKKDILSAMYHIKSIIFFSLFVFALLFTYNSNFSVNNNSGRNLDGYITDSYNGYFEEDVIDGKTGEVSRQASIKLWSYSNFDRGIDMNTLLGHGLTSSKFSNANTPGAAHYKGRINFASIQLTTYLWDVGVIGVISVFFVLLNRFFAIINIRVYGVYSESFRRGGLFLCMGVLLYQFYSNSMHTNSVSLILIVFLFGLNFQSIQFQKNKF
jgi:hypothetical protein